MRPRRSTILRYLAAFVIVAVTSVGADAFSRFTGTARLTSFFLSAVLLAAFYLGSGPGYFAAVLALLAHLYLVDPPYTFSIGSLEEFNVLALFMAASVLICILAGRVRSEAAAATARALIDETLLKATRELSAAADEDYIRQRMLFWMGALDALDAQFAADDGGEAASAPGRRRRSLRLGEQAFGVVAWSLSPDIAADPGRAGAIDLLIDTAAAAIARARLAAAKAEADARVRTEDLRNALLTSISHDLRTPLASIMGSASSLKRFADSFDVETRRDLAHAIEEETARLDTLIRSLLQMSRLQAGALRLERAPFAIPELIHETIRRHAQGREALFRIDVASDLPEALGDPLLFEQALGNVIENCLRHAGADSPVVVSARGDGEVVVVEVADRGPGVPPGEIDRIFEKFYRSGPSEASSGVGLGLAITRGFVEAMGGSVSARPGAAGGLILILSIPTGP